MDKYFTQLQKDFADWGTILPLEALFNQETSPFKRLMEKGFSKQNSRLVFSVCPDDVNRLLERRTIENALKENFGAEFHLGNLAAYPMGGVSGITAASHHPPDNLGRGEKKEGNLIIVISPHLGLTIDTELRYGYLLRPGQSKLTTCCGAMMGFLRSLRHVDRVQDIKKIKMDARDPTKSILFQELLDNYKEEIFEKLHSQDINLTIIKLAKLNYELAMKSFKGMMQSFLSKEKFEGDFAIIGGITINTQETDYFIFRDYTLNSI